MHLTPDEEDFTAVIGDGAAITYVCHSLSRKGISFYVAKQVGTTFLVTVEETHQQWLISAIHEFASRQWL